MQRETVGRPMEILLIEDSLVAARVTIGALRRGAVIHRLTWISDGLEAIEFLFQQGRYANAPSPDLVLLDLGLPGMEGREILQKVRASEHLSAIPIVVVTGESNPADIQESLGSAVQAVVHKPLQLQAFLELVERLEDHWKADMILPERARRSELI
jgi:CheY-like chemotaxis protein